jgi:exopolysaccharide biosynthesis protein
MTLVELALEMRRLGAVDAMNLDGGGSSTMVVSGRVVNLPSDENGERAVATSLLVLSAGPEPPAP